MDDAIVKQIQAECQQGLRAAQAGRADVAGQHFNKASTSQKTSRTIAPGATSWPSCRSSSTSAGFRTSR